MYCAHSSKSMCTNCAPLEPYDTQYLKQNNIKHLSFHSYLRKLGDDSRLRADKGRIGHSRSYVEMLELAANLRHRPKEKCRNHLPYPQGLCSNCAPSSILVQPQEFRMIDHIEFENKEMVDSFLQGWRRTGLQTFGYLYGSYEPYNGVPLGIKAVVRYIYEPLQDGAIDGFSLAHDSQHYAGLLTSIDSTASLFCLERVGMIYTDLTANGEKVVYSRNKDTCFLSCYEAYFIAQQQLEHPYSVTCMGEHLDFGSRFVTVVASGDENGDVDLSCYQLCVDGMKMVEMDLVLPSTDPSMFCVRQFDSKNYVPKIVYLQKSDVPSDRTDVSLNTNTFPVEYLITTLTYGFTLEPSSLFSIEGSFRLARLYILSDSQFTSPPFLHELGKCLGDGVSLGRFANLEWIAALSLTDVLKKSEITQLVNAIQHKNEDEFVQFIGSAGWQTLLSLIGMSLDLGTHPHSNTTSWSCMHCTFINTVNNETCEMCGLPN